MKYTSKGWLEHVPRGRHKLSVIEVDKNQMLDDCKTRAGGTVRRAVAKIFPMALELLARCGMISRATSRACYCGDAGHHTLSSTVHYSSVIFCNCLNLFGG